MDSLGELEVPARALYGIQTLRAKNNFPITEGSPHAEFIIAYAHVKKAAAQTNLETKKLAKEIAEPIIQAATEITTGQHLEQFIIDRLANITSFNMNANEVIANRALDLLGKPRGKKSIIHPNDHVNMSQSTNDTFPTAMAIAILQTWKPLKEVLELLRDTFWQKGKTWQDLLKSGRTHLQDATPISLGAEFQMYGTVINKQINGLEQALENVRLVPIGGTAVGTGVNTPPNYIKHFLAFIQKDGIQLSTPKDLPYIQASRHNLSRFSGSLRELALELIRIANDLRLLSSGPTSGIGEIELPAVQPGSSIMPGKVNPVMAESLNMLAFRILGNDTMVSYAVQAGQLELNVMMPLMIDAILDSMKMLIRYIPVFTKNCINGIIPNVKAIEANLEKNASLVTLLSPIIGYDKAAELAKEARAKNQAIRKLAKEKNLLSDEELDHLFSSANKNSQKP